MKLYKVLHAVPERNFILRLTFNDDTLKEINMLPFINDGISNDLRDWDYFKKVKVEHGYISWDNGFDFCPNFLYYYTPQTNN